MYFRYEVASRHETMAAAGRTRPFLAAEKPSFERQVLVGAAPHRQWKLRVNICRCYNRLMSGKAPRKRLSIQEKLLAALLLPYFAGCGAMSHGWTEVPLSSIRETRLEEFKVAGYVIGVIECPRNAQCIQADGIVLSPTPVPDASSGRPENTEILGHDQPTGLGLEVGKRYLFFFKRRYGVVKVRKPEAT